MENNMDWTQVFTIIATNVALMCWMRQDTKDFMNRIETWKDQINTEMKDFHGKLCAIEERNKK